MSKMKPLNRLYANLLVRCQKESLSAGFDELLGEMIMGYCFRIVYGNMTDQNLEMLIKRIIKDYCKSESDIKSLMDLFEEILRAVEQFVLYFHNTNEEPPKQAERALYPDQ